MDARDLPEDLFATPRGFIVGAILGGVPWVPLSIAGWQFVKAVL